MNDKKSAPIIIAGGSGFLGVSLAFHLARNAVRESSAQSAVRGSPDPAFAPTEGLQSHQPIIILSRNAPRIPGPWRHVPWDARTIGAWHRELDGGSALVNLVGRSVDCIKTPGHQDEILRSRVEATRILGQAMRLIDSPPPVWVQMSTAHIYGDPPTLVCTEDSPFGTGLAPFVGRAWEEAFHESVLPSQRQVILRPSFVVGRDRGAGGGALARLRTLVRLGLGGRVGTGRQGMSWIHELDMNRLFERAIGPAVGAPPDPAVMRGSPAHSVVRGSPDPALPPTAGLTLPPSRT
jgi:hypothetical protein